MKFDGLENPAGCPPSPVSGNGLTAILSPYFEPNWHPFYAERLAVFPRSVLLRDSHERFSLSCWPDLATLTEDGAERHIAYYPATPSALSLLLVFDKWSGEIHVRIYEDDRILMRAVVSNAIDAGSKVAGSL
jgi:hypothetical protein